MCVLEQMLTDVELSGRRCLIFPCSSSSSVFWSRPVCPEPKRCSVMFSSSSSSMSLLALFVMCLKNEVLHIWSLLSTQTRMLLKIKPVRAEGAEGALFVLMSVC